MLLDALPEPTPLAQLSRREGEMRYVTQHFSDLQGLKWVPLWAGALALLYAFPYGHAVPVHTVLVACGAATVPVLACTRWMNRWYKEHYGFVGVAKMQPEQIPGASLVLTLLFILIAVLATSPQASSGYIILVMQAQNFLVLKCFYACPQSRPVQLRRALYIAATLASISAIAYAAVCPRFSWRAMQIWLWSLLVLGLYDHWLLAFLSRPRQFELAEAFHE